MLIASASHTNRSDARARISMYYKYNYRTMRPEIATRTETRDTRRAIKYGFAHYVVRRTTRTPVAPAPAPGNYWKHASARAEVSGGTGTGTGTFHAPGSQSGCIINRLTYGGRRMAISELRDSGHP